MKLSSVAVILVSCAVTGTLGAEVRPKQSTEGVQMNPMHQERPRSAIVTRYKREGEKQVPVFSASVDSSSSDIVRYLAANYSKSTASLSTNSTGTNSFKSTNENTQTPKSRKDCLGRFVCFRGNGDWNFPLVNGIKDFGKWMKSVTHNRDILVRLRANFPLRELAIPAVLKPTVLMELEPEAFDYELRVIFSLLDKGNSYKWDFDERVMLYDCLMRVMEAGSLVHVSPLLLAKAAFELHELMRGLVRDVRAFEEEHRSRLEFMRQILQELAHPKSTNIFYIKTHDLTLMYLKTYRAAKKELHGFLKRKYANDVNDLGSLLVAINQIIRSTALSNEAIQAVGKLNRQRGDAATMIDGVNESELLQDEQEIKEVDFDDNSVEVEVDDVEDVEEEVDFDDVEEEVDGNSIEVEVDEDEVDGNSVEVEVDEEEIDDDSVEVDDSVELQEENREERLSSEDTANESFSEGIQMTERNTGEFKSSIIGGDLQQNQMN